MPRPAYGMTLEEYMVALPIFISDDPRTNKLIEGTELSPEQIKFALIMTLDKFNNSAPLITGFNFEQFPSPAMLLLGASIRALDIAISAKNRNKLPYSDSGLNVDEDGQAPYYLQAKQILQQEYETWVKDFKRALNVEQCYGSSPSEYSIIYPYTNRPIK